MKSLFLVLLFVTVLFANGLSSPLFKYTETPNGKKIGGYAEWKMTYPVSPLKVRVISESKVKAKAAPIYLIVLPSVIASSLSSELSIFKADLEHENYSVSIVSFDGGNYTALKALIKNYYNQGATHLLMIGNLPLAWVVDMGSSIPGEFPADPYFSDMDGTWEDTNNDGKIDSIPSKVSCEMSYGRLHAFKLSWGDEINLLKNYFRKNHLYRTHAYDAIIPHRALNFKDILVGIPDGMEQAFSDVTIRDDWTYTTAINWKKDLLDGYEWVHLDVHSNPWCHAFMLDDYSKPGGGTYYNFEPQALNPPCIFYTLQTCMVVRYPELDNIGNWYLFSNDYSLAVIGDTREAYALKYDPLYKSLGEGYDIGQSLLSFNNYWGAETSRFISGITLLGDPSLKIRDASQCNNFKKKHYPSFTSASEIEKITDLEFSNGNINTTIDKNGRIFVVYNTVSQEYGGDTVGAKYWDGSWDNPELNVSASGNNLTCCADDLGGVWFGFQAMSGTGEDYNIFTRYYDGTKLSGLKKLTNVLTYDCEPSLAAGKNGSMMMVYRNFLSGQGDIRSLSYNGSTWQTVPAKLSTGVGENYAPKLSSIENGYVAVWVKAYKGERGICYSKYSEGSWTEPQVIENPFQGYANAPSITTKNNQVYVAYLLAETSGRQHIVLSKWNGSSFDMAEDVISSDNSIGTPNLLVTSADEYYIGFNIRDGNQWEVAYTSSKDGTDWSKPEMISPDPATDFEPMIVQSGSTIKAIWYSNRGNSFWNLYGLNLTESGFKDNKSYASLPRLNLSLYPNPVKDVAVFHFNADLKGSVHLSLYDISGRLVVDNGATLSNKALRQDTRNLRPGVYTYKVITEKGIFTGRLCRID
jgi:hypothetical protein